MDPFEEEERVRWQEEEEKAKVAYFKMIKEEEERGYFRKTVAGLIEERIAAKKLRRELEMKQKKLVKKQTSPNKMMMKLKCPRATLTRSRRITTRG